MAHTIGFLGGGNMGRAIMEGLIKADLYKPEEIYVYDVYQPTLDTLQSELGVHPVTEVETLAKNSQTILVAVKPNVLPEALGAMKAEIPADKIVISIAAGVDLAKLTELLSPDHKIVRVMPNTPALVGEGMSGVSMNENLTQEDKDQVMAIFSSFGEAEEVPEKLMDAVVGVSGSAPAYVYMFIEALADGAVLEGMPRAAAYKFAAQTVLGSAKMVLETGRHPGELKDMVSSPGGTTIKAVQSLEENGMRAAVIKAVEVAAEKNRSM